MSPFNILDIDTVNQYFSFFNLIKPVYKVRNGRFPGTRGTHKSDFLAGFGCYINIFSTVFPGT